MEQDVKKEIGAIIGNLKCPKDFRCYKSGYKNLCKAKDIGLRHYLICLEEDPPSCTFSVLMEGLYFCQCPLRIYIAKRLWKSTADRIR